MKLEIIRDEEGFAALEPHWDALLEQSATPTPFLRWDWACAWWREVRSQFQLLVGVVREADGTPAGIAPFVLGHEPDGSRRHLRQIGLINGLGALQGERLDLLIKRGEEDRLAPVLCQVLTRTRLKWDVARLNKVPEESPNCRHLQAALARAGHAAGVLNRSTCHFIDLPTTWEQYEARQHGNWRRKMRKRWENLTSAGATPVLAGRDLPVAQAFEDFVRLHASHWPDGVSSFLRAPSLRLHREIVSRWAPSGRVLLPCIQKDGEIIAAIYGIVCGRELLQYQLGWNPDYARLGLGNLAMRWSVETAMRHGLTRYDMLPGDYEYKRSWCADSRHVLDLECLNPLSLRAMLFSGLRALKRRMAKPAPPANNSLSEAA